MAAPRIALLGAEETHRDLVMLFEAEGCEVSCHALVARTAEIPASLLYVAEHLGLYHRIVLDSAWSARQFAEALRRAGTRPKLPLLAVDALTGYAMEQFRWPVRLLPNERIEDGQIALLTKDGARVPDALADCEELQIIDVGAEPIVAPLEATEADALVVCAPGDAGALDVGVLKARLLVAAGPMTARALKDHGFDVSAVAARPTAEAIVDATLGALQSAGSSPV